MLSSRLYPTGKAISPNLIWRLLRRLLILRCFFDYLLGKTPEELNDCAVTDAGYIAVTHKDRILLDKIRSMSKAKQKALEVLLGVREP